MFQRREVEEEDGGPSGLKGICGEIGATSARLLLHAVRAIPLHPCRMISRYLLFTSLQFVLSV